MKRAAIVAILLTAVFLVAVGCGKEAETYNPTIDPANFVSAIDNQYFPLEPGTTSIYEGESGEGTERNEVYVSHLTKQILRVSCIEVRDRVWLEGTLIEETLDWYAQDRDGNVWYFGEDSKEYENGQVTGTAGSWEAGVDGAKPGIVMEADPKVGDCYHQEYYQGEAEDMADVIALNVTVAVPYGSFDSCLKTKDYTPLEPGVAENKYFAPGVGNILTVMVEGGSGRLELLSITND